MTNDAELRAEWLDTKANIEAVDKELRELTVFKLERSPRAHTLRVRRARLLRIKLEWEELIHGEC